MNTILNRVLMNFMIDFPLLRISYPRTVPHGAANRLCMGMRSPKGRAVFCRLEPGQDAFASMLTRRPDVRLVSGSGLEQSTVNLALSRCLRRGPARSGEETAQGRQCCFGETESVPISASLANL